MAEAERESDLSRRPAQLARYAGPGAPLRRIVGLGGSGAIGKRVLLLCGHWREIRDWEVMPLLGRQRPASARCGLCRAHIRPRPADAAQAAEFARQLATDKEAPELSR
jgi:hypothetical protein